jgi:hypothetical protein
MAEIKDVYSLEFNSDDFTNQLQSAIQEVESLQSALEGSADSTEEMEKATAKLLSVLNTEAKGIEQLNAKRNTLLQTQKQVNSETRTGALVSSQLTDTNKKLAAETGNLAGKQRSYFSQLLTGARNLNGLRRAASLVGNAFRVVAGINPVGLALTAIPIVIGLFTSLFKKAEETKSELERLNDPELGLNERKLIIEQEIKNLDALERKNKTLTDEQKKQRDDLKQKYKETSDQIQQIEEARIKRISDLEREAQRLRIKALGDTAKAVLANAKLETDILVDETGKRSTELIREQNKLANELFEIQKRPASNAREEAEANIKRQLRLIEIEIEASNKLADAKSDIIEREKRQGLQRLADAQILANSLAALEQELTKLRQIQSQKTSALDEQALANIQARIDKQQKLVDEAKKRIADLAGIAQAEVNIERLKIDLIADEDERRIALLKAKAKEEADAVVGSEAQKAEQIRLIQDKLAGEILEIQNRRLEIEQKEQERSKQDQIARIKEALDRDKAFEEQKLSIALQGIETRRNAELLDAQSIPETEKRREAVEAINKRFDQERLAAERVRQKISLEAEIAATQNIIEVRRQLGQSTEAEAAAIEKLRLQLIELDKVEVKFELDKEKTEEDIKELIKEITEGISQVADIVFDAVAQGYQRLISQLDEAVNRSKSALDEIRNNSENFNARQLELEKERLEKLQEERRKAAQREQAIGLIQLTTNSLVAISKAAAEGGIAAPFTIASTIISLLAGFAAARAAASNAFFEGEEYVDKNNRYPAGRDTVPARLNKGERVITTKANKQYWDTLSAIHHSRIPADVLNGFVRSWSPTAEGANMPNVMSEVGDRFVFIPTKADNSGVESRLQRIEQALLDLPMYMPKTEVRANARGIFTLVSRLQERREGVRKVVDR